MLGAHHGQKCVVSRRSVAAFVGRWRDGYPLDVGGAGLVYLGLGDHRSVEGQEVEVGNGFARLWKEEADAEERRGGQIGEGGLEFVFFCHGALVLLG